MRIQLTIVFILITPLIFGQNLVPNYSFEDTIACPNNFCQVYYCTSWTTNGAATPDYFNSCNSYDVSVPNNIFGHQKAYTGNAYCGIFTYIYPGLNHRIIIGRQLESPLSPGIKYYASIKVSLADSFLLASNNLGIAFSTHSMTNDTAVYDTVPYPYIYSQNVITEYVNWVLVSGSFIADSAYQFISIGNLFRDSLTMTTNSSSPNPLFGGAYYYVDDICVSTDSLTCYTSSDIFENKNQNKITVYPNPATNDLTIDYVLTDKSCFELYDVFGTKRKTLTIVKGLNTIELTNIDSGVYFYKVVDLKGNEIKTDKMIIEK